MFFLPIGVRTDILCNKNSRLELAYHIRGVYLLHVVFLDSVHESILGECCVFQLEVAKPGGEVCVCVVRERKDRDSQSVKNVSH